MTASTTPVFPLDLVVFPGEIIPLHIFEPRYIDLIRSLDNGEFESFGLVPVINKQMRPVGTSVVLKEIKKRYPKGKMDVEVRAIDRFVIEKYHDKMPGHSFPGADIVKLPEPAAVPSAVDEEVKSKLSELFQLLNIREKMPVMSLPFYSFTWAPYIGLPVEQRYELLSTSKEERRRELVIRHIDQILPVLKEAEQVRHKVQSNGHFPDSGNN